MLVVELRYGLGYLAAAVKMITEYLISGSFDPQSERYAKPILVSTTTRCCFW